MGSANFRFAGGAAAAFVLATALVVGVDARTGGSGVAVSAVPASAGDALLESSTPARGAPSAGTEAPLSVPQMFVPNEYGPEFHFTRAVYSSGLSGFGPGRSWATDFPKADQQFLYLVQRTLALLQPDEAENPRLLTDPELRKFPWLYMLEVGNMSLTPEEVEGLRSYLLAGGFLVVDDFWGTWEWANFESEMRRVFPGREIIDIPIEHEIFRSFYNIEEILQVPSINNAIWGRTWEQDGTVPYVRGILDDDGRIMVVINWNTDLGDAWEWAESPDYPFEYSSFAYKLGVNYIIYSMTH